MRTVHKQPLPMLPVPPPMPPPMPAAASGGGAGAGAQLPCPFCEETFTSEKTLGDHTRARHPFEDHFEWLLEGLSLANDLMF